MPRHPMPSDRSPANRIISLATTAWDAVCGRGRLQAESRAALAAMDDADLSEAGRKLRRDAVYDLRERARRRPAGRSATPGDRRRS